MTEFNDKPEGGGGSAGLKHTAHNHSNNKTQTAKLFKTNHAERKLGDVATLAKAWESGLFRTMALLVSQAFVF